MNFKKYKIGAVVLTMILLGSMIIIPSTGAIDIKINKETIFSRILSKIYKNTDTYDPNSDLETLNDDEKAWLDTYYPRNEDVSFAGDQNDIGYNTDAGDAITRSLPIYVGEPVDQTVPGRGRQGTLDPSDGDEEDWFTFTACEGQNIQASISTSNSFGVELADTEGTSCWSKLLS